MQFVLQVKNEMGSGISQATGQIKGLGDTAQQTQTKAKSSGMGVGQAFQFVALNAFNLASSLIQTKRSYEDLGKAENAQVNKRDAVTKATNKLQNAEITLAVARKKGNPAAIAKAENNLANAKLNVDRVTRAEKLGQIELNRAHEDFYLNIIPNVISGVGTFAGILQVAQNTTISFGGAIKKLVLPLAAISAAAFAIKTNFLGFRDFLVGLGVSIGNAIPALKPLLNVIEAIGGALGLSPKKTNLNKAVEDLRKQFQPLVDFFKGLIDTVMKGDWNGAFKKIGEAAAAAWKSIKVQFPILGDIESLVNKIMNGNWKGAFLQIAVAAKGAWETLIKSVPFFAGVDEFIKKIQNGNWKGAFDVVAKGAMDALKGIFGVFNVENFITQIQQIPEKLKAAINVPGATPWTVLDAMLPSDVKKAFATIGKWVTDVSNEILTRLKGGLTFVARTWIDPFLTSLFKWETWAGALTAQQASITKGGALILGAIFDAIFPKTKPGELPAQAKSLMNIWNTIRDWMTINVPDFTKAIQAFWTKMSEAVSASGTAISNFAATIWNAIIEGLKLAVPGGSTILQDAFNKLKKPIIEPGVNTSPATSLIDKWKNNVKKSITVPIHAKIIGPDPSNVMRQALKNAQGHASGFHGFVSGATPFIAGERGTERVDVTPMSDIVNRKSDKSGGGSRDIIHTHVYLNGKHIAEAVASEITVDQAVYR
jgi:hypothetical protein